MEKIIIKTDEVGRIVIPKEIRKGYNLNKGNKMCIKENKHTISIEKINDTITIDSFGRILIPQRLRKKYYIFENDELYLSPTPNGIEIQSKMNKYHEIINKLKYIEEHYQIGTVLFSNSLLYISEKYKELKSTSIEKTKEKINNMDLKYKQKSIDEGLTILIIYKKEDKLIELIHKLI